MKIYTKTGDKGFTSLIGGTRVPKYNLRIECYGTVDELNSYTGMISVQQVSDHQKSVLEEIQDRLFTIGSSLASNPGGKNGRKGMAIPDLTDSDVELLEKEIDTMHEDLPELKHFILPGGNTAASFCHIARCVCRRAERNVIRLAQEDFVDELVIIYLNRLSDYFFVLARKVCAENKIPENQWIPRV